MGLLELFIGDRDRYDYGSLCTLSNPFSSKKPAPVTFYGKDEPIPILLAAIMGLQHAFAMVGGLITPPLVVFKFTVCGFPFCPDLQQYAISAALITSGICSIINILQVSIPGTKFKIGSGILSVMGTSFTFLPIFEIAIQQMKLDGIDGSVAYGKMIGTSAVCALLELGFSLMPRNVIKKTFPPIVASVTVILIGVALTGTGMKYWGGGVVCAEMGWKNHAAVIGSGIELLNPKPTCTAGETSLLYGSSEYIGLGFSVMAFLVFIELFGSIFMKNCNVVLALLFGYFVAAVSRYDDGVNNLKYVVSDNIKNADPITFLWTETFPLGFYAPAVVPLLIAYLVTTVETIGDISAVYEVSELDTESTGYDESIQGGLTADAVNSVLSTLFTSMPNTTFSQNNGVIALTKCASRRAGIACGIWLIFMGIFGKIAGFLTSIPDCVLGGMTIFLFSNVLVSGITLANNCGLHKRRTKFIFALSLAIGVGVTVWPYAFQDMRASGYTAAFWTCGDCSNAMKGLRNGVSIFLSTGYCVGTVVAMLLHFILPEDTDTENSDESEKFLDETVKKEEKFNDEEPSSA